MDLPERFLQILIEDEHKSIAGRGDKSVLQALIDGGAFIEANCGGRGACGKCRIELIRGCLVDENGQSAVPVFSNSYLACQVYPNADIVINLKRIDSSTKGNVILDASNEEKPLVRKLVVKPQYSTVESNCSLQETLINALKSINVKADISNVRVLQPMAEIMAGRPEAITVVVVDEEVIAVESGDTSRLVYGAAFDIGTTTVAGMLVELDSGKIIASLAETNPQSAFGADVISRIDAAKDTGGLSAQTTAIRQCLNRMITGLCKQTRVRTADIYAITIAGNTTMEHLFLGVSPISLVTSPYVAGFKTVKPILATEVGIEINPHGKVVLLPNVESFIGADTTAAVLAVKQDISDEITLLVDLGTNGEMVIGNRERLFACSTAVGPAFEGAQIRDGMRAAPGAIFDITITDDVLITTIGGSQPAGICGSGIVKGIAELIKQNLIIRTGRFNKKLMEQLPPNLSRRLKNDNGLWEFVLVEGKDSATGADISITQEDIRQIQLVKSAICSGLEILLEKIAPDVAKKVFLAGAFGNYIDIDSALKIGMLPGFSREQVMAVGNAAGSGAVSVLLSKDKFLRCQAISSKVSYVELAASHKFQERFLHNLNFPTGM